MFQAQLKLAIKEKKLKFTDDQIEQLKTKNKKLSKKKDSNEDLGLSLFPKAAYWRVLNPKEEVVLVPTNPTFSSNFCSPTVSIDEAGVEFIPKHNYDEIFDIPVFKGNIRKLQ